MNFENITVGYLKILDKYLISFNVKPIDKFDSYPVLRGIEIRLNLPNFSCTLGSIKEEDLSYYVQVWTKIKPEGVDIEMS